MTIRETIDSLNAAVEKNPKLADSKLTTFDRWTRRFSVTLDMGVQVDDTAVWLVTEPE